MGDFLRFYLHIPKILRTFALKITNPMTKKFLFITLIAALCFALPVKAQFIQQMSLMTPHYYPGEVYFTDGHSETFYEVELPRVTKSNLDVRKSPEDKKRTTIEGTDIVCIKFWHRSFPDKVHVLYYVQAQKAMMRSPHQWGVPVAESNWGVLFQCEANYEVDKMTGELNIVKFVGGSSPDTPTLFYLKRKGDELANLLIFGSDFAIKRKVAELFKENPAVYKGIKSGKLKPADMQSILDEMASSTAL